MAELTVVIVSWNGRHHLETCLPALRAQTFRDFAVVLVDNGSTVERGTLPEISLSAFTFQIVN